MSFLGATWNFHTKIILFNNFLSFQPAFADSPLVVLAQLVSIEKLPPPHLSLVDRVGKTANIIG
jgi:hypothetical protein